MQPRTRYIPQDKENANMKRHDIIVFITKAQNKPKNKMEPHSLG